MIAIINVFVMMTALGLGLIQDTATSCRPAADLSPRASMSDADRFNRMLASDDDFEVTAVPLRQGVLIGRRVR